MNRKVIGKVKGHWTEDGAGVKLVRVLGHDTADALNPFLMLDSFDSKNYDDYKAGFPTHPHRGIETISYIHKGGITHEDSLGNKHRITDKQVQWMRAGSGILHSETFEEEDHLLGLQIWVNLQKEHKMTEPHYLERSGEVIEEDFGIRTIYSSKENSGSPYVPLLMEVLEIEEGKTASITMDPTDRSYLFTLVGQIEISGETVEEKTAAVLGEGEQVEMTALTDAVIVALAAPPLHEPIAWGGPIVMNTREELGQAFAELRTGEFLK